MNHSRILALIVACDFIFGLSAFAAQTPVHRSSPVQHRPYAAPAAAVSNGADYFGQLNHPYTWPASKMPLRVYIKPATGVPSYKPQFQDVLERSLAEWSEATNGRVRFSFTDKPADADVEIEWMRNLPKNKVSHEIGVTEWTKDPSGVIKKTHTILLTVNVDGHEQMDFNVKQAALHELGHVLGIQGHSPVSGDIMTLSYNFVVRRNVDGTVTPVNGEPKLTARDKNTIQRMYDEKWLANSTAEPLTATAEPAAPAAPAASSAMESIRAALAAAPHVAAQINSTGGSAPNVVAGLSVGASAASTVPVANPANSGASSMSMLPVTDVAPSTGSAAVGSLPSASTRVVSPSTASPPSSYLSTSSPAASPPANPAQYNVSADVDALLFGKSASQPSAGAAADAYTELVRKGIAAIKHGDYDSAIATLRQACATGNRFSVAEKNLIIALTWKANQLYSNEDYSNAADNYKSAVSLRLKVNGPSDPKIAETMPALIYSLRKAGRTQEADQLQSR